MKCLKEHKSETNIRICFRKSKPNIGAHHEGNGSGTEGQIIQLRVHLPFYCLSIKAKEAAEKRSAMEQKKGYKSRCKDDKINKLGRKRQQVWGEDNKMS